jgi:hypothetical protein
VFISQFYCGRANPNQTELSPYSPIGNLTRISGGLIETGSITADKIVTSGITILPAQVNGLSPFATATSIPAGSVTGLSPVATGGTLPAGSVTGLSPVATGGTLPAGSVTGLGGLATQSSVNGSQVDVSSVPVRNSPSGGRQEIYSNRTLIYDSSGILRVKIGYLL